jgi:hypothetical protein
LDEVVPVVSDRTFVADFAMNGVWFEEWETSDDTWFVIYLAVVASEVAFVCVLSAVFTSSGWESWANRPIHVDFKNPITDEISLVRWNYVLFWEWNLEWRWHICLFKFMVIDATCIIWIVDSIVEINVSVQINESRIIQSGIFASLTSI